MVMTTTYDGELDAKTGDDELDSLLSEIRSKTGKCWQCDIAIHDYRRFFGREQEKHYSLLLYVGGVLPYQLIMSGSGNLETIKAYLIGYLSGFDCRDK